MRKEVALNLESCSYSLNFYLNRAHVFGWKWRFKVQKVNMD